jgi:hypothetical protein
MNTIELTELAHFLAEPETRPRQFQPLYCEILDLVRLLMIPAG